MAWIVAAARRRPGRGGIARTLPQSSRTALLNDVHDPTLDLVGRFNSIDQRPAPFLAPRFEAAHCSVLFSATLAPAQFHADLLGLPDTTAWLDVAAPFSPEQLAVHLVPQVSTRWAARQRSLAPIAELIAQQYLAEPGR